MYLKYLSVCNKRQHKGIIAVQTVDKKHSFVIRVTPVKMFFLSFFRYTFPVILLVRLYSQIILKVSKLNVTYFSCIS